jgi:4-hydroxybenzoate polyprenyltransferase
MWRRILASLFFSNWFLGILAIALSIETSFQLGLPVAGMLWHTILFSTVVLYYTYAYLSASNLPAGTNLRSDWYGRHREGMIRSQKAMTVLLIGSATLFVLRYYQNLFSLPVTVWIIPLLAVLAALSYYGKLPFFNLRFAGWTKPITIGFCWAVAVTLLPILAIQVETSAHSASGVVQVWLFLKNWLFCSVNAALFDIKDFEDDTNKDLKTFAVRFGIRFTVLYLLLPMIVAGMALFFVLAAHRGFTDLQVAINLIPFVLTLFAIWSLQKQKHILFYLIFIDGTLLIKALCGIAASVLTR